MLQSQNQEKPKKRLHKIDAGELSASTTTDTNTNFATPSTTKRAIA